MTNITDFNALTGESITRPATEEEIIQQNNIAENQKEKQITSEIKAAAKAALLERLGITADEAALLLG